MSAINEKTSAQPDDRVETRSSDDEGTLIDEQHDRPQEKAGVPKRNINTQHTPSEDAAHLLENPFMGKDRKTMEADVDAYCSKAGLEDIRPLILRGALLAQSPKDYETLEDLSEEERQALRDEREHKWWQTKTLYWVIFGVSMAAVVQGMDETVINGAQLTYPEQFGISSDSRSDTLTVGFVNAIPYICSALFSCWLTYPLNRYFGRRGAIFISTFFAGITCIWSAVTNTWWHLAIARFFLGIGIGPKSATAPLYAAEVAPTLIRGALVMQWQVWTAFGIMLGTVSSLIFQNVPDQSGITGLAWRLMLGSACLPAFIVCAQVMFLPESPRWLISRGRYADALKSYRRLRRHEILAARDLFLTSRLIELELEAERAVPTSRPIALFKFPRNRRAVYASSVVMFGQQFCGVNAIAYYSSTIFRNAGASNTKAFLGSFGFGLLNWTFALPAFFTIDRFGRRSLLLATFPFLAFFMFIAGMGFLINDPQGQLGMVVTGIYLYTCFYSSGMGPVPFSYSAEVYPIQVREVGMALATATTWFFNAVVALTFPLLLVAFTNTGAFCWYAGWNVILLVLVLLLCPETKQLSLEELDHVFAVPTRKAAAYGILEPLYWFRRVALRQKTRRPPLYAFDATDDKAEMRHIEQTTATETQGEKQRGQHHA